MPRRTPTRLLFGLLLGLLALGLYGYPGFAALLASSPPPEDLRIATPAATPVAFPGVNGLTYTDPGYGYRLTWDPSWTVKAVPSSTSTWLQLSNGMSEVYIAPEITPAGDPRTCLERHLHQATVGTGRSNVRLAQGLDGRVLHVETTGRAYAVFTFTFAPSGAQPEDYVGYIDCRVLVPGQIVLSVQALVEQSQYNAQAPVLQELLSGLVLPAVEGAQEATPGASPIAADDTEQSIVTGPWKIVVRECLVASRISQRVAKPLIASGQYLVVAVTISNTTQAPVQFPVNSLVLTDTTGRTYHAILLHFDNGGTNLQPGTDYGFTFVFDVALDAETFVLSSSEMVGFQMVIVPSTAVVEYSPS